MATSNNRTKLEVGDLIRDTRSHKQHKVKAVSEDLVVFGDNWKITYERLEHSRTLEF